MVGSLGVLGCVVQTLGNMRICKLALEGPMAVLENFDPLFKGAVLSTQYAQPDPSSSAVIPYSFSNGGKILIN